MDESDEATTPEEQEAYDAAVTQGMKSLYTPGAAKILKEMASSMNNPAKAAATIARDTIVAVDRRLDLPETVIAHAAQELLMAALELMTEAKLVSEEELPDVTTAAAEQLQVMLEDYYESDDEPPAGVTANTPPPAAAAAPAPAAPVNQPMSGPESPKVMG